MSRSSSGRAAARLLAVAAAAVFPVAALAVPAAAVPSSVAVPPAGPQAVPGAWIVTLEPGASSRRVADEHARQHGARVDHVYGAALRGYAARMSEQAAAVVAQDPRVASLQRDQVVTIDAKPGGGSGGTAPAQTVPFGVQRIDGALSDTVSGDGDGEVIVDVAVIDTGIASHPDLVIAGGVNCSSGRSYADGNGHGTHVAGTIGAKDDKTGVVGVAPGARLHAVRVLNNQGSGTLSSVLCGVNWVTERAGTIEVANMSLGGGGSEPAGGDCDTGDAYHDAICRSVGAGVTYVVAAGNSSADSAAHVPAAYDEVITVSALSDSDGQAGGKGGPPSCRTSEADDTFASFSNFGEDVDLIAPGVCINSTWLNGGYNMISGTSMASPHVAGAAALSAANHMAVHRSKATPDDVRTALLAASKAWDGKGDHDGEKEPLLNVAAL